MKQLALATLGLLLGTSTAMAHILDGRWAFFAEACTSEFSDATFTVNIADGEILYWESGCSLGQITAIGEWGEVWRAALACSGEGETWTTDTIFGLQQGFDGEADRLVQIDLNDGFVMIAVRCGK